MISWGAMEFDILLNIRRKSELIINIKEEKLDLQVASISSVVLSKFCKRVLIFSPKKFQNLCAKVVGISFLGNL